MVADPVPAYIRLLEQEFSRGTAPDGTAVVSTPFRYLSGDRIELAMWQEGGRTYLSDRGRLFDALSLVGTDPFESAATFGRVVSAMRGRSVSLSEGTLIAPVTGDVGRAMEHLIQAILDAQVVGYEERKPAMPEAIVYDAIRDVLEQHKARYRERSHIGGSLGRRYPVDFRFAVTGAGTLLRAVVVVGARHNTLAFAERWNFRFRDIHQRHERLKRVVVLGEDAPWTADAQKTLLAECDGVYRATRDGGIEDFVGELAQAS